MFNFRNRKPSSSIQFSKTQILPPYPISPHSSILISPQPQSNMKPKLSDPDHELQSDHLMPYLGLRARISLAWLSYPILIILLIVIQLILTLASLEDGRLDSKRELSASCAGLEAAASLATSLPHFMAQQTNQFIISRATDIVHGLASVLDLSLQAIQAIVLYVVDTYRSLYRSYPSSRLFFFCFFLVSFSDLYFFRLSFSCVLISMMDL